jgi:radical SAM superfamily enzyme YgiQ (UPF0313 family)
LARVLLAKARFVHLEAVAFTPPVGLLYVAASLREHGHEVAFYESGNRWDDPRPFTRLVERFRPDVVGIGALTPESVGMDLLARTAKAVLPDVPVVVGGPHPTAYPLRCVRNPAIDYAVIGEGELAFPALVAALTRGGRDPHAIPGIAWLGADGGLETGGPPRVIEDLDALPLPAWDLAPMAFYQRERSMAHVGQRAYLPLVTSRGCPYQCIYCHQIHGKRFRSRSPENVLAEVRAANRRLGIRDFEFYDDTFNLNRDRMEALLDGFAALKPSVDLHFPNGVRTDLLVASDFPRFRRAGTRFLAVAVESASPRIQKLARKNLDLDRVFANIEAADRAGLFVNGFFMLGFPTETPDEARGTVDFALRSRLHEALFFVVNPFEGTPLYDMVRDRMQAREATLRDTDMDYFRGSCNVSAMTDAELFGIQRSAYLRFYASPGRLARIATRHPRRAMLGWYAFQTLVKSLPRPRGVRPSRDALASGGRPAVLRSDAP